MALKSVNPMNGELIREYPEDSEEDVRKALLEASCAFAGWRTTTFAARAAQKMRAAADRLDARRDELARLMALEMGKPLAAGRAELEKCAATCRFYADNAERFLADEPVRDGSVQELHRLQPARRPCSRSCPGTSRSGRCSASRRPR